MARRKLEERNTRRLQHSSGSYYLSLPIELIRQLKWREKQKVVVKRKGKTLVIRDYK